MINKRIRTASLAGVVLVLSVVVTGCIQPQTETELTQQALATMYTNTPTIMVESTNPPPAATSPPVGVAPTNPSVQPNPQPTAASDPNTATVAQFVQSRGDVANNLAVWDQRALGPDQLYGFSYTNMAGLPCTGFLLTALVSGVWQPNNGGVVCAPQPGTAALAGVTFFLTSDGQPYTIAFGRADDPTVSALGIVYEDGSSDSMSSLNGGFLFIRAGVAGVQVITAIDSLGNTVIPNVPQSPPV